MMELSDGIAEKGFEKRKEVVNSDSGKDLGPLGTNFVAYPKSLAKFEDVIADPELFRDTLMKLHAEMHTKFMVPVIGGKSLDLHRLFNEVTSRGGIDKVIADRKWKDVTAAFSFPSTATNASFILRKYYMSLLRHYEQIYLFGAQGWNPNDISSPSQKVAESYKSSLDPAAHQKRRKDSGLSSSPYPPVVGVIDGKFENGYLVTVAVGSETLKGVLYHTPEQIADDGNSRTPYHRRRRRQKKLNLLDPNHPKPKKSGYNFFFAEQHAQLKPLYPSGDKEIGRIIGVRWNALNEAEKAVYQEKGLEDKERYEREMTVYNESLRMDQLASNIPSSSQPLDSSRSVTEASGLQLLQKVDNGMNLAEEDFSSSDGILPDGASVAHEDSEIERSADAAGKATPGSACSAERSKQGEHFESGQRMEDEKPKDD